ncbi:MAG: 16S rRNA (cytidine(1402)-2'-O)-methyltransferase [Cytophagaceae bacterium]
MADSGKLYLIPTPIGNLEDITLRALRLLKEVDLILAEDTRTSGQLLKHFEISTKLQSFHLHNEHQVTQRFIQDLKQGKSIGLVSDAGTPGISDPGFLLVRAALQEEIEVECLPGATAFVPALINSGFPCDRFVFEGFLPHKKGRQTRLLQIEQEARTSILYESPHRLVKLLQQCVELMGDERKVSVSRELTKKFEETVRGTAKEVLAHFTAHAPKGEFVVVISGKGKEAKEDESEEDDE